MVEEVGSDLAATMEGAFGGAKAGGAQDPLVFLKKPIVMVRLAALVSWRSAQERESC